MNPAAFDRLTDDQRRVLRQAGVDTVTASVPTADDQSAAAALCESGRHVVLAPGGEVEAMRTELGTITDQLRADSPRRRGRSTRSRRSRRRHRRRASRYRPHASRRQATGRGCLSRPSHQRHRRRNRGATPCYGIDVDFSTQGLDAIREPDKTCTRYVVRPAAPGVGNHRIAHGRRSGGRRSTPGTVQRAWRRW